MNFRNVFRVVQPFFSAVAVITTGGALVFTIYFTELGSQWTVFLGGVLVAAILAEATRMSHSEWIVLRRTAQLTAAKNKLDRETQLRKRAEETIAADKPRLHLIDDVLPTMVALFDSEGRCQYHNRAFIDWLHLRADEVHMQHIRKVLGTKLYQEIATSVHQSLDGHPVHYEQTQLMPDGAIYKLLVEHQPQFSENGKVTGFFMLINDITSPGDVHMPASRPAAAQPTPESVVNQNTFVDSFSEEIMGQTDANHIRAAIEKGDFRLFCQLISPLAIDSAEAEHFEILVRLLEEEEGMMPPGAFFPLAEKHGLLPHLDRWVVQHVVEWATHRNAQDEKRKSAIFFINISGATMGDATFPEFLKLTLADYSVPGALLCFEVSSTELAINPAAVAEFAQRVRLCGCRIALSGFGKERIAFDHIRGFQVDFLKVDGSIVFDVLRSPVALAKVTAINRVAKTIGMKTVAELVENEETIAKLREIGIDYGQGFGISRPQPLAG